MRFLLSLLLAAPLTAAVSSNPVDYKDGDVALQGILALPGDGGTHPGVLVVPEWWGCNDYVKRRAAELAEHGYIAFAADMYGAGKVTTDPKQAGAWAGPFYQDRALLLRRAGAALAQLTAAKGVDSARLASIGFCFGGTVSLELARAGLGLKGVVSFHGGLATKAPAKADTLMAKILVLHGGADPLVPPKDVAAFFDEMTVAKADWRMEVYGQALHAFSNPAAAEIHKTLPPVDYNADAEKRSLAAAYAFLGETLR